MAFGSGTCFACKVVRSWKSRNPKEEVYLETCQHCLWDFLFGPAKNYGHMLCGEVTLFLWPFWSARNPDEIQPVDASIAETKKIRCDICGALCTEVPEGSQGGAQTWWILQSFLICDVDDVVRSPAYVSACKFLPRLAICSHSLSSMNAWEVLYEFRCYKRTLPDEPRPPEGRKLRKLHPFVSLDLKNWNDVIAVLLTSYVHGCGRAPFCEALFPKSVANRFLVICLSNQKFS